MSETGQNKPFDDTDSTSRSLLHLLQIMQTLRSPRGCPWDAEQTPESLTPYIIEEACELVDAIDSGDTEHIRDELGDLLLQVVFQAQIFDERGDFHFRDVAEAIATKLIRRHPHVFDHSGDRGLSTTELNRQWEAIKQAEQQQRRRPVTPDHLPKTLPALQRAQKTINRLSRADLQSPLLQSMDITGGQETRTWLDSCDGQPLTEEKLGRALLRLVYHAELSGLNAEQALRRTLRSLLDEQHSTHSESNQG